MATRDTGQPSSGISRRDFLKTTAAATAVVGCGLDFAFDAEKASAYEGVAGYTITPTTCPYCSASCGQRVVKDNATGKVVDIYGDFESPFNSGGLCAKGAGSLQLVTNPRRIGAWNLNDPELAAYGGHHPVNDVFLADTAGYPNGIAWKRTGNDPWQPMDLQTAMDQAAAALTTARGAVNAGNNYNSKSIAFFGSSHMNNEPNYLYRKLIADFGTSNVEHQARI